MTNISSWMIASVAEDVGKEVPTCCHGNINQGALGEAEPSQAELSTFTVPPT